jgi:small subunit ribosomal protein S1
MDAEERQEAVNSDQAEAPVQEEEHASSESESTPTLDKGLGDIDFDKVEDMSKIYELTLKDFEEGEVVRGKIVSVAQDSVLVDIGFKSEGTIQLNEFPEPDKVQVGDEIDVLIEVAEDQDGMIVLSKTKADKIKNWAKIQEKYENNELVEGKIIRKVKGGFKVDIGLDAFLPASQIARRPVGDLDQYIGKTYEFRIIKLTKRRRNVVLSRKQVLEEARSEEKAKLLANLEVGLVLEGTVKNITDFGAFIDVGGIDGLLHITDMSWGRIKHPSEVVSVGEHVRVKVLNFDKEEEKISLGFKQLTPNPWTNVAEKYPNGAVVRGKVVSMTDYGAFVQLEEGVEGMVHISEMSWTKRVRHPSEIVHIGQEIDVKLLKVDAENEKISLGLKQIGENPWMKMKEKYPEGSVVNGLVRNLTDYGAFIQIEEGIDGLLHISDMSWTKKINHPSELLKKGDELDVQILNIDVDNEKISLGIKQLESDPWSEVGERYRVGDYVETTISKLVSFGAFARLDNGIEGLIHISELSKERINKPEEVVQPGETVIVKIISTDPGTRKIGLSLKQYKQELEEQDVSRFSAQEAMGTVSIGDVAGGEISARADEVVTEKPPESQESHSEEEQETGAQVEPSEEEPVEEADERADETQSEAAPESEGIAEEADHPEQTTGTSPEESEQPDTEEEEFPKIGTSEE